MKYRIVFLVLVCCVRCSPPAIEEYNGKSRVETIRNLLLDHNADKTIVVSHRGDWRNAPENSIQAIRNCIEMGVDIVEVDVQMTKDSILVLMHDLTLDRTTTGKGYVSDYTLDSLRALRLRNGTGRPTMHLIPTLEEAMIAAKGNIMVNLDKCYVYFDKAFIVLEKTETTDHVLMKGMVTVEELKNDFAKYLDAILFMPVVNLNKPGAERIILDYQNQLNPVAFEFIFSDTSSHIINQFGNIRDVGSRVWVNALWSSLNGGFDDDQAVLNADSIYGWYNRKKINMIQTDRPKLLLQYLKSQGLHN
ncbi:MAG: glycerophosphoryl diester phosphodiesterase [Cyclobacteriaceae bacterium]|jgi:glycerophosphoryl diester phosphodiesterase